MHEMCQASPNVILYVERVLEQAEMILKIINSDDSIDISEDSKYNHERHPSKSITLGSHKNSNAGKLL